MCPRQRAARPASQKSELRNRAQSTLQAEAAALDAALAGAAEGAVLVIPGLKDKIEAQLGHSVSLSGMYRMLARHGWRKVAPDTAHPQGNAQTREDWKKNSSPTWRKCAPGSPRSGPSG